VAKVGQKRLKFKADYMLWKTGVLWPYFVQINTGKSK